MSLRRSGDVQRRSAEFNADSQSPHTSDLTDEELAVILRLADVMIPGDDAWPRPSRTQLADYIRTAARRASDLHRLRAIVSEFRTFKAPAVISSRLSDFEEKDPVAMQVLIEFVYYGYYAQHDVVQSIRKTCDCDYVSPPQPTGYRMPLDRNIRPVRNGHFKKTEEIRRLDVSFLDLSDEVRA